MAQTFPSFYNQRVLSDHNSVVGLRNIADFVSKCCGGWNMFRIVPDIVAVSVFDFVEFIVKQ